MVEQSQSWNSMCGCTLAAALAGGLVAVGCGSPHDDAVGRSSSRVAAGAAPIQGYGGKCLDDSAAGTANGNKIQLWDCNASAAQQWTPVGSTLVGPGNKCLDVQSDNQQNGTIVQLWDCNGTEAQNWTFQNDGTITSAGGLCLDVTGYGTADGTQIQIWSCTGGANQQWSATAAGPSANCTVITGAGQSIVDAQGHVWTLSGGVALENGSDAGYSANVVALAYANGEVYQENSADNWWGWSGGTWVASADPTTNGCSVAPPSPPPPPPPPPPPTGRFRVSNGQILDPSGQPFFARGIGTFTWQLGDVAASASGAPLTTLFPGVNFVRVYDNAYSDPSAYASFINTVTSLGIVVVIVDSYNGTCDCGGSGGTIFTGAALNTELSWYQALATAYADNPYVWLGTNNEPSETDANGNQDPAALSTWQQQTYNAIRSTGNTNVIMVDMNCGPNNGTQYCGVGYAASAYAGMTNIVWDPHFYAWVVGYSTDQATVNQAVAQIAASTQQITSADGVVPLIFGEFGDSTSGAAPDADGPQVVTAVMTSGFGNSAWAWTNPGYPTNTGDNLTVDGSLTSYGQQVAAYIAAGQ